jgi:glycerol-3-phosphate dehydrogenase
MKPSILNTDVLIVGGGATGTGLARDLALRGVRCMVVEKKDINAGASGGNHGLLHSGARYIASDPAAALECRREGDILKRVAGHCIEATGGLFVAVGGDDETYIADFPGMCARSKIPATAIDPEEAREMEPGLSERIVAAFSVEDATIDPFMLSLDNMADARRLGATLMTHTRVTGFRKRGGKIRTVMLRNAETGGDFSVDATAVVNAAGAWAGQVAAMAGTAIDMLYSKGSLLVTSRRVGRRVVNRLRKATDADIVVPGGTVSIVGTTSERVDSPDVIHPEIHEVDHIIEESAVMMPGLEKARYIRAYCGVRPLIRSGYTDNDRSVSRGYSLIDHGKEGIENFFTITGGKLTTFRLMAEKTADLVCRYLGNDTPCVTAEQTLPPTVEARWTEPGLAPRESIRQTEPGDTVLCECEMVSESAVDSIASQILANRGKPCLKSVGLRSRVGKGPCQGAFCSQRVLAHLYHRGYVDDNKGAGHLRGFIQERWRGQHPLLWDMAMVQADLLQAMHNGLFSLELVPDTPGEAVFDSPEKEGRP